MSVLRIGGDPGRLEAVVAELGGDVGPQAQDSSIVLEREYSRRHYQVFCATGTSLEDSFYSSRTAFENERLVPASIPAAVSLARIGTGGWGADTDCALIDGSGVPCR